MTLRPSESAEAGDFAARERAVSDGAGPDGAVDVGKGAVGLESAGEELVVGVPDGDGPPGPAVGAAAWVPVGAGTAEGRGAFPGAAEGETGAPVALAVGAGVAVGSGRSGVCGQISPGTIPAGPQRAPLAGAARIRGADASISAAMMM